MTEQTPETQDHTLWVIGGFIAGVIVSVLALQYYGYLKLSDPEGVPVVAEFRLMTLDPDYDVRVSPKSSGKEAFCESGYLLLRPQNDKQVAGILVDSKNRAIACQPALSASGAEE
ncbi:hypothetical protein [Thalassolituus sp.]|jgi:hypothetical protein|uniref:hypothetical protein n=1 Tax=Thalassolituus sp. TaxID=2030822 RepID=UPI00261C6E8B|nr:hypothetical protein [uncultured Thalassolituus sp.]TNC92874.1 MAG: hypothetical protein CSH36_02295 [Thalassolituus sp.]